MVVIVVFVSHQQKLTKTFVYESKRAPDSGANAGRKCQSNSYNFKEEPLLTALKQQVYC
jgi:hypothetical protein